MKTAIEKIQFHLEEAQQIAKEELGLNNIFYNERYLEMFIADKLGHEYGNNTQGGDAIDKNGNPTEYKAINLRNKSKKGTFQFHWLSENKMKKYAQTDKMYFAVRDGVTLLKIYELPTTTLMPLLEAKSSGSKSINAHFGFDESKLLNEYKAKLIYQKQ